MLDLKLTEDEAKALLNLVDGAVKAYGLQMAEPGLYFMRKIQNAPRIAENELTTAAQPGIVAVSMPEREKDAA